MTTIATDGKSMAGDGLGIDHVDTICSLSMLRVHHLADGRVVGGAGSSFDVLAWKGWIEAGKVGACPIESDKFAGLILNRDGVVLWVDHKGREIETPAPCAIGSGQDYALGAMEAGASPAEAVEIACRRDVYSGGEIITPAPPPAGFYPA